MASASRWCERMSVVPKRIELDDLLTAASKHAELTDEPDHEVGDLVQILHATWPRLASKARDAAIEEIEALGILDWLDE